jgi:tetratricopeptide (TPR) repeat protein
MNKPLKPVKPREEQKKKSSNVWKYTLAALGIVIAFGIGLYFYMNHKSSRMAYDRALEHLEVKGYYKASEYLKLAIYYDPKYSEAYLLKAQIDAELFSLYRIAIEDYKSALEYSDSPDSKIYYLMGKCNYHLDNYEDAISELETAIKVGPTIDSADFYLAKIYNENQKDYKNAIKYYDIFLAKQERSPDVYLNRGHCKKELNDFKGAILDFDNAIKRKATYGEAYYNKAICELSMGDTASACTDASNANSNNYEKGYEFLNAHCGQ